MVVSFLPLALMASASALPSGSVKPPSIRTASRAPEIITGARKNPFSPAGKCFQISWVFAAIAFLHSEDGRRDTRGGYSFDHVSSRCHPFMPC